MPSSVAAISECRIPNEQNMGSPSSCMNKWPCSKGGRVFPREARRTRPSQTAIDAVCEFQNGTSPFQCWMLCVSLLVILVNKAQKIGGVGLPVIPGCLQAILSDCSVNPKCFMRFQAFSQGILLSWHIVRSENFSVTLRCSMTTTSLNIIQYRSCSERENAWEFDAWAWPCGTQPPKAHTAEQFLLLSDKAFLREHRVPS